MAKIKPITSALLDIDCPRALYSRSRWNIRLNLESKRDVIRVTIAIRGRHRDRMITIQFACTSQYAR